MVWKRPPGPPRVWKIVNVRDSNGVNREFTIQEIPEDRYDEAIDHICSIFIRREPISSQINLIEDAASVSSIRELCSIIVSQGISIATYDTTGKPNKPNLAAVNILYYNDADFENKLHALQLLGDAFKILFDCAMVVAMNYDPRKLFGVDGYLTSFSMCVDPMYSRLGLATAMYETRYDIGREYNFQYTTTVFSNPYSAKAAINAGFVVQYEKAIENIIDEKGKKKFPTLSGISLKILAKKLF